ncbi:MAG: 4Fe-4S binding protein [Candidatus Krumholzibacteriota bacterium]|nr:4Fe-4S binding protein [Candidatus Krumholzibacteriota bacterium]
MAGSEPPALPEEENLPVASGHWPPFSRGNADDYKEIAIISGKGGSGKTTVVSSLAVLADDKVLADNDVDAADLHLLLVPSIREEHDFVGGTRFTIDEESCTGCGACAEACRFNAIRTEGSLPDKNVPTYRIDELACEGCGLCRHVCAFDAVHSRPSVTGKWFISGPEYSPLVHARLGIAEENSGRLVTRVRNEAAELTRVLRKGLLLGDGPPGTGCPVIASVSGADLVLVVTEPTVSGVHDMERVLSLADHFGIPSRIVINKSDLNREQAERIERIARERGSRVVARIPFDRNVNDALMVGKTVIEYARGPACGALQDLWEELRKEMKAKEVEK